MEVPVNLSVDTYQKIVGLATIANYINQDYVNEVTPENIIKNAIMEYLEKYFEINEDHEKYLSINLGSHYPLKNRIGKFLKNHSLNATEIAKQLKIDKSTLSYIVNNKNQPSLDIFLRIWFFLGCPPLNEILYREKE